MKIGQIILTVSLIFIVILIIMLLLAACTSPAQDGVSPPTTMSDTPLPTVTPLFSVIPSVQPTASPSPTMQMPDTDIPDVAWDGKSTAGESSRICEYNDYTYFTDNMSLYRISNNDKSVNTIDEICGGSLIIYDSFIYYTVSTGTYAGDSVDIIRKYDPETGVKQYIFSISYSIGNLAAYNNTLYFTHYDNADDLSADLYSVNLDGTGEKLIIKNVNSYSIYADAIYYMADTSSDCYEPTTLYTCGLDGKNKQKLLENVYPEFQICGGKLYCYGSATLIDLTTMESEEMPTCDSCINMGQFFVYLTGVYSDSPNLCAYDTSSGQTFLLIKLEKGSYWLDGSLKGVFVSSYDGYGTHISKLTIKNGKASLKEQTYIKDETVYNPSEAIPKKFSSDTVIIADGDGIVMGGFSDGKWLSNIEAGEYCLNPVTFYSYNLLGFMETVQSKGAEYYDEMEGGYSLDTPDDYYGGDPDDPYGNEYIYTVGPDRFPVIEQLSDTLEVLSVIQAMIDKNLGQGAAQAQIITAVKADVDNDGETEIIVNADNSAEVIYEDDINNLYTISCIIESDGSVCVISQYYLKENTDPEFSDAESEYIQNIIDIDGDGKYEIVLVGEGYEVWWTIVYKYDGKSVSDVLDYSDGV